MKHITTRQYRVLADQMDIYQFMLDNYDMHWKNGVAAPFLEYALSSDWMNKSYTHKNRIWEDNGEIVGFCFYESPSTNSYFNLKPGYEELAPEMVAYAEKNMPNLDGDVQFILMGAQEALINAAKAIGYEMVYHYTDKIVTFDKVLDHKLPEGFHFVDGKDLDMKKVEECCYKGFNHEEEGPFTGDGESWEHIKCAPHATMEYALAIANEQEEYVCFAGMWWLPQNNLAYMEPLCTVPNYRHKGLASAILSEHYRRMKALGATHMTGGDNPFYDTLGYEPMIECTHWKKHK